MDNMKINCFKITRNKMCWIFSLEIEFNYKCQNSFVTKLTIFYVSCQNVKLPVIWRYFAGFGITFPLIKLLTLPNLDVKMISQNEKETTFSKFFKYS